MNSPNYSYVTALTTDSYLIGVLALQLSLKHSKARYGLTAVLTDCVSEHSERLLIDFGVNTFRIGKAALPDGFQQQKQHWTHSFGKLSVFDLTMFDKIVFIDSDMMVLENVDSLFGNESLSATQAGRSFPGNEHWKELNSGLMVLRPQKGLRHALESIIPGYAASHTEFGDQDIVQELFQWPSSQELVLGEEYNVFFQYIEHYVAHKDTALHGKSIKIVHFIGQKKPWMASVFQQIKTILQFTKWRQFASLRYYVIYLMMIYRVKTKILIRRNR